MELPQHFVYRTKTSSAFRRPKSSSFGFQRWWPVGFEPKVHPSRFLVCMNHHDSKVHLAPVVRLFCSRVGAIVRVEIADRFVFEDESSRAFFQAF